MPTHTVKETPCVNPVELLLLRAVIDSEFRSELLANPEEFGIPTDTEHFLLPASVALQDMSFVELVNDATSFTAPGSSKCRCTCVSDKTTKCDGTSF